MAIVREEEREKNVILNYKPTCNNSLKFLNTQTQKQREIERLHIYILTFPHLHTAIFKNTHTDQKRSLQESKNTHNYTDIHVE